MKKLITFLCIFLSYLNSFAQLDTEHWFAPMFDRASIYYYDPSGDFQYLYLSTNETTPFNVKVYNNNREIATATISKGSPQKIFIKREFIISRNTNDLFKPINKGLYVKGDKKFFANLRFSTIDHAEIITSKGLAGIGLKFYTVIPPITDKEPILNFMTGILATEDNTRVKVSGYKPDVDFTNYSKAPTTLEFTLNKGQSYIIEGENTYPNKTGFIGAKIEADKPINITNGNFNGQYAKVSNGSDIIMDQSVPVDRLGKEFAIVKGNGDIGRGLEGAIVVATENNTKIYVNNETAPIAHLNEGDYYVIPDNKYQPKKNGHYNLYIKSDKNVYLYQLLAGVQHSSATLGFNYIPPLNCFLPRQIGEIGLINEMIGFSWNKYTTVPTKLNFITIKGAKVEIENINLRPEHGPFPLTGNDEWVTYSIPNVSGNINIKSSQSITAGLSAGDGVVGYGGYFAGFSTVPAIRRTGNCRTGITLEIDNIYDLYQWYLNGNPISGANSHSYKPTKPGIYTVKVTNSSCSQTTAEFKVEDCTKEETINVSVCNEIIFAPSFKDSPKTEIDLNSITIIKQPTKGTVDINKTNSHITYRRTPKASDTDSFSYKFCGKENPNYCKTVTVNIDIIGIDLKNATVSLCDSNNATINLKNIDVAAKQGTQLSFYKSREDADNERNPIDNPEQYTPSSDNEIIYVLGSLNYCYSVAEIHITKGVQLNDSSLISCTTNGQGTFNLEKANIGDTNGLTITYHESKEDAERNEKPIKNHTAYNSTNKKVFARAVNKSNCVKIVEINLQLHPEIVLQDASLRTCSINGTGTFNLYEANIGNLDKLNTYFYTSRSDAENNSNPINNPTNYQSTGGKVFVKATNTNHCSKIVEIDLQLHVNPTVDINNYNATHCDTDSDGSIEINFADVTSKIVSNGQNYTVKYYLNRSDAHAESKNTLPNNWKYSTDTRVFVLVKSNNGCFVVKPIDFIIKHKIKLIKNEYTTQICSTPNLQVNLADYIQHFTDLNDVKATYFNSLDDAEKQLNPINGKVNLTQNSKFFIRLSSTNHCDNIASINFNIIQTVPSTTLKDAMVCHTNTATLDAGTGFTHYKWSTGATTQTITVGKGQYWVELTSPSGCVHRQTVNVTEYDAIHLTPSTISVCSVNDMGVFDLTTAKIGHKTGDVVKYYPTEHDANAETREITQPKAYSSAEGKVYAKVTSQGGCSAITEITLKFYDKPTLNINNYNASHCDINFDGKVEIDFSKVTSQIVNPQAGYSVKYYASQNDANNNQGALPNNWSYAQNTAVFVKVTSKEGCSVVETINFTIKDRLNLIKNKAEITLCDTDFDTITEVNLADYIQQFTNENVSATYYLSLADAQKAINAIPSNQKAKNQQKYYIRLGNATHCDNIAEIDFRINTPKKSTTLKDVSICNADTTVLEAGAGFTKYLWSTGETTSNITAKVGEYWVDLTTDTGCIYRQHVKVIAIESPKILSIDIKENTATVLAEGGTPPYEYSLDGRTWQSSNVFANLQQGKKYTVFVRSKGDCEPVSQDFVIIKLVNLITPNGDGFNDVIDYSALTTKANAKFNVYDRYGALVFEGNNSNQFIWDGKAKGRPLPTASYWYQLEWQEPNTNTWVKTASWILLKNRE